MVAAKICWVHVFILQIVIKRERNPRTTGVSCNIKVTEDKCCEVEQE